MLRSLRVSNYRGLREFRMDGLTRVNLLVGTNNCGKTTVLEAIHTLAASGSATPLLQALSIRGELVDDPIQEYAVARLFPGHRLVKGDGFRFEANTDEHRLLVSATLVARDASLREDNEPSALTAIDAIAPMSLQLDWASGTPRGGVQYPITSRGGARPRDWQTIFVDTGTHRPVLFLPVGAPFNGSTSALFERIVLTPDETTVIRALQVIDPGIERVAVVGGRRAGFDFAMMVGGQRIPIGSMGDGIARLLGISVSLVSVKGGVLLVDEIDTGLHYSVLVDMWRLVLATARELDVQVFATTHSRDAYEALAAVAQPGNDEISLHRIERGKEAAVRFSEAEILQAAERGLEVR